MQVEYNSKKTLRIVKTQLILSKYYYCFYKTRDISQVFQKWWVKIGCNEILSYICNANVEILSTLFNWKSIRRLSVKIAALVFLLQDKPNLHKGESGSLQPPMEVRYCLQSWNWSWSTLRAWSALRGSWFCLT